MTVERIAHVMVEPGAPLVRQVGPVPTPGAGEALIEVAGCGVCHTDLGFLHEGVKTRKGAPIVLGHEIAGTVLAAGEGVALRPGTQVVVPAVMPCGECALCRRGRENSCSKQVMPGNDRDGGFATHVVAPARFLCPIEVPGKDLWRYGVVADAVATAYQAVDRARVKAGDVCVVVGTGGVGGFAVQICAARGAFVVGIDPDGERLASLGDFGLTRGLSPVGRAPKELRTELAEILRGESLPSSFLKIFETSGTAPGQELALGLLGPAALISVVGYSTEKVSFRLSTLMAYDARIIGTWGCRPQLFPAIVELCRSGRVRLDPFIEAVPLAQVAGVLDDLRAHRRRKRPVLVPPA